MKHIDISHNAELARIAEEVRKSNEPCVLRRDGEDVAVVVPIERKARPRAKYKSEADYEAFRSAAGGWKDVDTDALLADIYAARRAGMDRPAVDL